MSASTRSACLIGLTMAMVVASFGCAPSADKAPSNVDGSAPPAQSVGADLVQQRCTMCHTLDRVESATYDRAGWTKTVDRMKQNGLVITPDEESTIIDYLTEQSSSK